MLTTQPARTPLLLRAAITVTVLATAAIHPLFSTEPQFLVSAAGYVVLLAALYVPFPRPPWGRQAARALLLVWTLGTIGAWYLWGPRIPLAYTDKIIEVVLVALLVAAMVTARRATRTGGADAAQPSAHAAAQPPAGTPAAAPTPAPAATPAAAPAPAVSPPRADRARPARRPTADDGPWAAPRPQDAAGRGLVTTPPPPS